MAVATIAAYVHPDVGRWITEQRMMKARGGGRTRVLARIDRLIAPGTHTLWKRLNGLARKHTALDPVAVCMEAVTAPEDWTRLSRTPRSLVVKDGKQFDDQARRLAKSLKAFGATLSHVQQGMLNSATVTDRATSQSRDQVRKQIYFDEIRSAGLDRYLPSSEEYLCALGDVVSTLAVQQNRLRPRKMDAANADRTFVILTLKRHFQISVGICPNELIADLVNAVLQRTDTSTDTVRKA
jgi:hypothetical protein